MRFRPVIAVIHNLTVMGTKMNQTRWVGGVVACALSVALAGSAVAEQRSTARRGTVKVHSRLFNPFDVGGSQISVDRFGIVTYRGGNARSAPSVTPYWASAAAFTTVLTPTAPVTTAASTAAAVVAASSVATVSVTPASGSLAAPAAGADLAIGASVRPPYRPPVRSPFRPPPRPPFIP